MVQITDKSSAQEIISNSKDLVSLSKVFAGLTARIAKQDLEALETCTAVAEGAMDAAQPYLIKALPSILDCVGHKKSSAEVRAAAEKACFTITEKVSPNAVQAILPILYDSMGISVRWQSRVAALKAIHSFGDHAPEQLGFALPEVIPQVSTCIVDLKKEVCEAAETAMVSEALVPSTIPLSLALSNSMPLARGQRS